MHTRMNKKTDSLITMKLNSIGYLIILVLFVIKCRYSNAQQQQQRQTICNTSSILQYNQLCGGAGCVNLTYTAQLEECLDIDGTCQESSQNTTKRFCLDDNSPETCLDLPILKDIKRCIDVNITENCTTENTLRLHQLCTEKPFQMCLNLNYIVKTRTCSHQYCDCLLYTSPSPRDLSTSRMPSSA